MTYSEWRAKKDRELREKRKLAALEAEKKAHEVEELLAKRKEFQLQHRIGRMGESAHRTETLSQRNTSPSRTSKRSRTQQQGNEFKYAVPPLMLLSTADTID